MIRVTYSSVYGSSMEYAEHLAFRLGLPAEDIISADVGDVSLLIHFGGLYAGTMAGLCKAVRKLPPEALLAAVSVGLADPSKPENAAKIDADILRVVPEEMQKRLRIFRLRGRMDYPGLSTKHRAMMWMLCRWIGRKTEKSDENQAILDTYGSVIDFMDFSSLDPIAAFASTYR